MPRGSKPGERRGGRQAGTPNKVTAAARSAIEDCFDSMGGPKAFTVWAQANPTDFYTKVYIKILPLQLGSDGSNLKKLVIEWQDSPSTE